MPSTFPWIGRCKIFVDLICKLSLIACNVGKQITYSLGIELFSCVFKALSALGDIWFKVFQMCRMKAIYSSQHIVERPLNLLFSIQIVIWIIIRRKLEIKIETKKLWHCLIRWGLLDPNLGRFTALKPSLKTFYFYGTINSTTAWISFSFLFWWSSQF